MGEGAADVILLTGLIAVLWIGLVPTYSQSSFVALLAGLAVLAALRWSWRWTLGAVGIMAILGVVVVLFAGGSSKVNFSRLNIDTSGRANLVSGGIHLFTQRPVYGYGSGSFQKAYVIHVHRKKNPGLRLPHGTSHSRRRTGPDRPRAIRSSDRRQPCGP